MNNLSKEQIKNLEEQDTILHVILDGIGEDDPWSRYYNFDRPGI